MAWAMRIVAVVIVLGLGSLLGWMLFAPPRLDAPNAEPPQSNGDNRNTSSPTATETMDTEARRRAREKDPRYVDFGPVVFWWDAMPKQLETVAVATGPASNMHKDDYDGPQSCRKCHADQFENWYEHSHRRMNALADSENVEGNFTDGAAIDYLGGTATFFQTDGQYRMRLQRGTTDLTYEVRQTIGSRFFQYYIGRLIAGPFEEDHPYRVVNHVLPFGYWLDRDSWVPVVHVGGERPDGLRDDPFALQARPTKGIDYLPYAANCSMCHTTYPLGDDLTRKPREIALHAPANLHWDMAGYFREQHPELWGDIEHPADVPNEGIHRLPEQLMDYEAVDHAVTLGISCEACHLGAKTHAENPEIKPDFHPHSPHLMVQTEDGTLDTGRTHQNLNWTCARCHVGTRPRFAAGMATWNSVEYSDAMLGSCYSQLKCVDCHDPHQGIGKRWTKTPQQDDRSCIRCHSKFEDPQQVTRHTHHDAESSGSRCMNCHMPRINEGLQDVVRTHTIFSPTNPEMIEANHPNACNLCHTEEPVDWTLDYLRQWYGATFDETKIRASYPRREAAVASGWMTSDDEAVRLVGADAACRTGQRELLPDVLKVLDDPFLLNRQFTMLRVEKMLGVRLDDYGYQFYDPPSQRAPAIEKLRADLPAILSRPGNAPLPHDSSPPGSEPSEARPPLPPAIRAGEDDE